MSGEYDLRCCDCGAFVKRAPGVAWMAAGEFGEDTDLACRKCVAKPGFRLMAGNGSTDAKWCGIIQAAIDEGTPSEASPPDGEGVGL